MPRELRERGIRQASMYQRILPVVTESAMRYTMIEAGENLALFWFDRERQKKLGRIEWDDPLGNSPLLPNTFLDWGELNAMEREAMKEIAAGRAERALAILDEASEILSSTSDRLVDEEGKHRVLQRYGVFRRVLPVWNASGRRYGITLGFDRLGAPYAHWLDRHTGERLERIDPSDPMKTSPIRVQLEQ